MPFSEYSTRNKNKKTFFWHRLHLRQRILLINWAVLVVPVVGVLWSSTYRQSLIENELKTLQSEVEVYSSAIAESALFTEREEGDRFDISTSQYLLHRTIFSSDNMYLYLWDSSGEVVLDRCVMTDIYNAPSKEVENINFFQQIGFQLSDFMYRQMLNFAWLFSDIRSLPLAQDTLPSRNRENYPEVSSSLSGESQYMIRRAKKKDYTLEFSVAVPIKKNDHIYGSLHFIRNSKEIDEALGSLYKRLIIIFLMAKIVMLFLSSWLTSTIASPLYKLTTAANYIRENRNRKRELPDFSHRNDEIGQLSHNLRTMLEALWKRMDAIESFTDDVSHELRNPLTSLKSAVETLDITQNPKQIKKLKRIIHKDVERLNRLISDISDASRLDTELSRSQNKNFDFKQLAYDIHSLYQETYKDKEIYFAFLDETSLEKAMVRADDDRVTQVMRNLICNAISFSPFKGIITSSLKIHDKSIILDIMDEGPGIADHALEKIFQRFYTERPQAESFGNHSGLGLSISLQIVQNYHGSLVAFNRKDGKTGAIFRLSLPLIQQK